MKKTILTASFLAILAACNPATEAVIPNDPSTWEKELAPAIAKLKDEDKELLRAYLVRMKLAEAFSKEEGGVPIGTTIGKALEDQRKWRERQEEIKAEAAALKRKLEKDAELVRTEISKAVTFALISKSQLNENYAARRYSAEQNFKIGVKNNSQKELIGVSGALEFIDVFDKVVGGVTFSISEKIKPGGEYTWIGSRDYNQFNKEHRALWNLEEGKYTTRFVPTALVYADGTKVSVEK